MSSERALLKGALIPSAILAPVTIGVSGYFWSGAGLAGALLAQLIVLMFFATNLLVARISRDLDPMMTMALAMMSYVTKVFLLGIFLWLITTFIPESACNRTAFAIAAIMATFAWLGGEITAYLKLDLHLQLPPRQ
ncbi:unannotated protein [freshwater metagenome]|uniref:Unannotated protein n=1 Tax=freshwater metagenome TaxID=449393 RepID=A0A6J5ZCK6_9ZZZZ|nr:hypothetical protein [Actinomycetota bacterium]